MAEVQTRSTIAAARLTNLTEEIAAEVRNLPADLIHWIPAPGVWTVMDNLCHIREFVPFWTGEALRIARRSGEGWGRDQTHAARVAAVTNTSTFEVDAVLADIRKAVRQSAEALKTLTDDDLAVEATSKNPHWGVKPASFVVDDLLVDHLAKHQGQIRRNVSQFKHSRQQP